MTFVDTRTARQSRSPHVSASLSMLAGLLAACGPSTRPFFDLGVDAGREAVAPSGDVGTKDGAVPERDGKRDSGSGDRGDSGAGGGRDGGGDDEGYLECSELCWAATPFCDHGTGECVACLTDEDCEDELMCRSDGRCVECKGEADCEADQLCTADGRCGTCASNADCVDAAESHCKLDHELPPECLSCEGVDDCKHIAGRPYCSAQGCLECQKATEATDCTAPTPHCSPQGNCGECAPETEEADCGVYSCDRETFECTTVVRGDRSACESCQGDSECATGMACVEYTFQPMHANVSLGKFCFYRKATIGGCGNTHFVVRPYSREVAAESADGDSTTFCLPITSCAALADADHPGAKACTVNEDCGVANLNDGHCIDLGSGSMRCTYACNSDHDCPGTGFTDCTGTPGACIP